MTDKLQIPDGDHTLTEGRAWLTVGPYSVRVNKTDEGIAVDIYALGDEMGELLGATWVHDNDLPEGELTA